jgi:UDP-glucose 4-epimerase
MKILITGATGFIGSHICNGLVDAGHDVVGVSRDKKGPVKYIPWTCDISKEAHVDQLFNATPLFDAVIHTAAYHPHTPSANPAALIATNVTGTANLMEAAMKHDVDTFIHSSSMSIYGTPKYLPVDEIHPCRPEGSNLYPATKLMADLVLANYVLNSSMRIVSLRYSGVFGQDRGWGAIHNFIQNVLDDKQPEIYSSGDDIWDTIHVSDVIKATILALESEDATGYFNIGRGEGTNIKDIAEKIIELSGNQELVEKGPKLGTEPSGLKFVYDISKSRSELGYEPTPIEEGLTEYIEYEQKGR